MQLMQLVAAAEDAGVDMGGLGGGDMGVGGRPAGRSVQQDNIEYEEFRQPDVNGDNVISKLEVGVRVVGCSGFCVWENLTLRWSFRGCSGLRARRIWR